MEVQTAAHGFQTGDPLPSPVTTESKNVTQSGGVDWKQ